MLKERKESRFVKFLEEKLKDDRAALARLRRGLGKEGGTTEMYRYVAPFLPTDVEDERKWQRIANRHFLIASLFALHPESTGRGSSMGKVFRAMMTESPSVEKRFENLLSVDVDDLDGHLRQAVSLAKSKRVWVDFHQLFDDIKCWNYHDRSVQMRWAREFWGYEKEQKEYSSQNEPKGEAP
ncbi:MAG TPA: type I-E CRISPR-associated protein Cse2/CasB [Geobacteraceae bacterium]